MKDLFKKAGKNTSIAMTRHISNNKQLTTNNNSIQFQRTQTTPLILFITVTQP